MTVTAPVINAILSLLVYCQLTETGNHSDNVHARMYSLPFKYYEKQRNISSSFRFRTITDIMESVESLCFR